MDNFFLSSLFCLFYVSVLGQNPARSGTDHAVFFYVTDFQPGWEALPATKTDAEVLGKELQDSYGFKVEYVRNPSKADIENKILELNERKFGPKDQLLLYFSMHGHFIPNANRGYLIPTDGKIPPNDPLGKSWLSYDDLAAYLSLNGCKHILLSLDACYSGAFGDRWMSYPGNVEANADAECRTKEEFAQYNDCYLYFTSGSREVRTPADSKFANRWLKALQEGRAKKVVTTNDLRYNFGTIENPKPEGGYFSKRERNTGDFVFIHKTACAAAPSIGKSTDKAAWNNAKTTNTFDAYRQYVADFPNGEFRPLAESRIADLEKTQKEEQAWADAKRLDTWEAYDGFIKGYPNSDYKELAEHNLSKLMKVVAFNRWGAVVDKRDASAIVFDTIYMPQYGKETTAKTSADLPNFVFVQGGPFSMGSKDGESNETPHDVTLSDFYLAVNELTFDEYDAFCNATGASKPDDSSWGRGKRPVINVSWEDAAAYCNWRSGQDGLTKFYTISGKNITPNWSANGYRLPTEAEWEFAARSRGKDEKWAGTSSESSLSAYGNFCDKNCEYDWKTAGQSDGYGNTAPVGSFRSNALGLNDLSGNVWEWCNDWYDSSYYGSSPSRDPHGPDSGSRRVLRGGSWNFNPSFLRCALRNDNNPDVRYNVYGFRLARAAR